MKDSFINGIFKVSEWVMRFSVINILWIIFNIPTLFLVASILFMSRTSDLVILLPLLCLTLPLFFFPATQAMFASMRVYVMKREEEGLIKMYWRFYKENYKNSFISGILLTILWVILAVDVYYFSQKNVLIMFVFVFFGVVLYVLTLNYLSVGAHYDMKLRGLLKNAFFFTFGSPMLFFAVLISSGIILLISIYQFQLLFFFFTGSLIAFLAFSAFYQTTLRLKNYKEG